VKNKNELYHSSFSSSSSSVFFQVFETPFFSHNIYSSIGLAVTSTDVLYYGRLKISRGFGLSKDGEGDEHRKKMTDDHIKLMDQRNRQERLTLLSLAFVVKTVASWKIRHVSSFSTAYLSSFIYFKEITGIPTTICSSSGTQTSAVFPASNININNIQQQHVGVLETFHRDIDCR
jgi:hypothetical protein